MAPQIGPHTQLWVDALRSGEYKQGRGCLRRRDDVYCCLGVLCDVFRQHEGQGDWDEYQGEYSVSGRGLAFHIGERYATAAPPDIVWNWVRPQLGSEISSLIAANDDGVPFDEIADMIEADPVFDR